MKQQTQPITDRIVVTHEGPTGIVARVNGKVTHFQNREDLFRTAVLLTDTSARAEQARPPRIGGV